MADIVTPVVRSRMMSAIRSRNTKPEIRIRSALHQKGFRFRLHVKGLPGKPDIVLPRFNAAVFVHGCFWHGHDCKLFKLPATRTEFWEQKIVGNRIRDERQLRELQIRGWRTLVVWECVTRKGAPFAFETLIDYIQNWLMMSNDPAHINSGGLHVQLQNK